jgi:AhpD family alkylhydroperoxidase
VGHDVALCCANGDANPCAVTQEDSMNDPLFPQASAALAHKRAELAPEPLRAFKAFSAAVFADGALPGVTKQLIAVAVAHVTQCPYCIKGHTAAALKHGASEPQIMEAIWVAAEMRAGGAYAHSALALDVMQQHAHADHAG